MPLPAIIKATRGDRSPELFAGTIGCSLQTVRNWETGATVPTQHLHVVRLVNEGVPLNEMQAALGLAAQAEEATASEAAA